MSNPETPADVNQTGAEPMEPNPYRLPPHALTFAEFIEYRSVGRGFAHHLRVAAMYAAFARRLRGA